MSAVPAGLCESCAHSRVVQTGRSTFYLCERSREDPRYPRYPALPVMQCPGYETKVEFPESEPRTMDS